MSTAEASLPPKGSGDADGSQPLYQKGHSEKVSREQSLSKNINAVQLPLLKHRFISTV